MANEGVEALGELREQVGEVLLGLDGGGDGLAGGSVLLDGPLRRLGDGGGTGLAAGGRGRFFLLPEETHDTVFLAALADPEASSAIHALVDTEVKGVLP